MTARTTTTETLYSLDAEQAALGAALIDPVDALPRILALLDPVDFWLAANRYVFEALAAVGERADPLTVEAELRRRPPDTTAEGATRLAVVGEGYLAELLAAVPTALNAETYAQEVADYAQRRRYVAAASEIAQAAHDLNRAGIEAEADAALGRARSRARGRGRTLDDIGADYLAEREREAAGITGIPSYRPELDAITGGWRPGQVVTVAGPTGSGKSTLMLNFATAAAAKGRRVAVFSLEMDDTEVMRKLVADVGRVDVSHARRATDDDRAKEAEALDKLRGWPLVIRYAPGASLAQIGAECGRLRVAGGLDLVIVDYLQIMDVTQGRGETRAAALGAVTRGLKQLAGRLKVPVILGSQLNREADAAGEPQLWHLRESGSIEQDSDVVMMLHTPKPQDEPNVVKLLIRKQRSGRTGAVEMYFTREHSRFGGIVKETVSVNGGR